MSVLEKLIDKRIAACQTELIQTHYAEVENMYRQMQPYPGHEKLCRLRRFSGGSKLPGPA